MPKVAGFLSDRRQSSLACAQRTLTPAEGTELPQVNSSFKAHSDWTLCFKHKDREAARTAGEGTADIKYQPKPLLCTCSPHTVTPKMNKGTVDRRKQSGEKKQKTLSGISTSLCESNSTCIHVNRGTCGTGTGD